MTRLILPIAVCAVLILGACSPQPLEEIEIPFAGESVMAHLNGDPYRFFRYENPDEATADMEKVSKDGSKIDGESMPWDGNVHFFHLAKRIVIYIGDNEETIETIENVFGPQVIGD